MSGGRVAYHLRTNKAIDRHVFIDLLIRVHGYRSLAKHRYIGFGGPFLEDFRLVHGQLGLSDLTSIEADAGVLQRQKFNKPVSSVRCLLTTSGDFITSYESRGNAIIWLDFATANEQRVQLQEFQQLLPKLLIDDVVKITLNASPDTLGSRDKPVKERQPLRKERLQTQMGEYLPNDFPAEDADQMKGFARLLYSAALKAAHDAFAGLPHMKWLPLTAFRYSDSSHQMLTLSGVIIDPKDTRGFLSKTGIAKWGLFIGDGTEPIPIDVPSLSVRERLFVDARLPTSRGNTIVKALKFNCGEDAKESARMLDSYGRFYRHLPYFSRIVP